MCKAEKFGYFEESFFTYRKVPTSNTTAEIKDDTMIDILEELVKMYKNADINIFNSMFNVNKNTTFEKKCKVDENF